MLKSLIIAVVIILSTTIESFAENTILWYLTIGNERISYSVDISDTVGTERMTEFNNAVKIMANVGNYSNLQEFEDLINRHATGDIRNFHVIDVIVDER